MNHARLIHIRRQQLRLVLRVAPPAHDFPAVRNHIRRSGRSFRTTGPEGCSSQDMNLKTAMAKTDRRRPIPAVLSEKTGDGEEEKRLFLEAATTPGQPISSCGGDFLAADVLREAATLGLSIKKSSRLAPVLMAAVIQRGCAPLPDQWFPELSRLFDRRLAAFQAARLPACRSPPGGTPIAVGQPRQLALQFVGLAAQHGADVVAQLKTAHRCSIRRDWTGSGPSRPPMKNGKMTRFWGFVRLKGQATQKWQLILFAYLIMKYFVIRQLVIYRTLITTISSACRGWALGGLCGTQPTCR